MAATNAHVQLWQWIPTLYSQPICTVFYEAANSYDLTILCDLSKPQWQVGLGAGLGVGHSYKFIQIGQKIDLAKIVWICTRKSYELHN